jgi:hypothetical protein
MTSKYFLAALAVGTLGLGACSSTLPPGHYEDKSTTTNSRGTNTTTTKETDVYYDENGRKQVRTETETTKDPKGLFNKTTTKSVRTTN